MKNINNDDKKQERTLPLRAALCRALREDYMGFLHKSFVTTHPGTAFQHNWHLRLLAEYLEACRKREITRLIINLPPRSLKSLCVSVAWPAFLLGHDPSERIMVASYAQALSVKHAQDTRLIMQSGWYRNVFPHSGIARYENEKHKFVTQQRGYRLAISVGGTVTGEGGGNILIVDDPTSARQALSDTYRQHANQWFDTSFATRLDNKQQGVMVVVMQRLHQDDLTGYLLRKGGWEQLVLPATSTQDIHYVRGNFSYTRTQGEPLHAGREGHALLATAQRELGSAAYAAQYQQMPLMHEGSMVKRAWLKRYQQLPETVLRVVQSWDTAIKAGAGHDASACATFAEAENGFYLMDMFCIKAEYPELKRACFQRAALFQPDAILIEDKASGQSLVQDLLRDSALPVIAIKPQGDKLSRLAAVSALMESGRVYLPDQAPWLAAFEAELCHFPHARHDDQVDAVSQYLHWARGRGAKTPTLRRV